MGIGDGTAEARGTLGGTDWSVAQAYWPSALPSSPGRLPRRRPSSSILLPTSPQHATLDLYHYEKPGRAKRKQTTWRHGIKTSGRPRSNQASPAEIDARARIAPALLDGLGLATVDVLGHHTGALLATEIALQFPDRVRKVIINGPFPITQARREELLQNLQTTEIDFEYRADGSHLAQSFRRRYEMYGAGADPKLTTRVMVEKFQGFGPFWYGHNAAYRYDHAAALQRLKHRTLILTNTTDMIYDLAQKARQMRPDFDYAELEGGGVDIVDKAPDAWSDAVAKFLGANKNAAA